MPAEIAPYFTRIARDLFIKMPASVLFSAPVVSCTVTRIIADVSHLKSFGKGEKKLGAAFKKTQVKSHVGTC